MYRTRFLSATWSVSKIREDANVDEVRQRSITYTTGCDWSQRYTGRVDERRDTVDPGLRSFLSSVSFPPEVISRWDALNRPADNRGVALGNRAESIGDGARGARIGEVNGKL